MARNGRKSVKTCLAPKKFAFCFSRITKELLKPICFFRSSSERVNAAHRPRSPAASFGQVAASFLEELLPKEKPPADLVNFSFAKVAFDTVYFKCHFGVALLLIFYRSNNGGSSVAHSNWATQYVLMWGKLFLWFAREAFLYRKKKPFERDAGSRLRFSGDIGTSLFAYNSETAKLLIKKG